MEGGFNLCRMKHENSRKTPHKIAFTVFSYVQQSSTGFSYMKQTADKKSYARRKSDAVNKRAWERTVEDIAMTLCPPSEWEDYEIRCHQLARICRQKSPRMAEVKVMPIWWKYRREASRVATIQQAIPPLRYLPLKVSSILGEIFLK